VANKVAIFSNGFNFQFDNTRGPLGMMCPTILADDNQHQTKDWTVFVLFLSLNESGLEDLKRSLATIEGEMLLFLRRLRRLTFSIDGTLISHWVKTTKDNITAITRSGAEQETLTKKFVLHVEDNWALEALHPRLKIHDTTTVLAFPLPSSCTSPILANQHLYAFLPLRRTSFTVHAS
jgi:hypothetical protein